MNKFSEINIPAHLLKTDVLKVEAEELFEEKERSGKESEDYKKLRERYREVRVELLRRESNLPLWERKFERGGYKIFNRETATEILSTKLWNVSRFITLFPRMVAILKELAKAKNKHQSDWVWAVSYTHLRAHETP